MKNRLPNTQLPFFFLGIDVGKADLFCYVIAGAETSAMKFTNTPDGIGRLLTWLASIAPSAETKACLEQTGHYGKPVAKALFSAGLTAVHLVNPRRIKAYGEQKLRRNKSDTADARLIAEFLRAEHHALELWSPPSAENEAITGFSRYAQSIVNDNAQLKTRKEATTTPSIIRSLNRRIKAGEKELADIRKRIKTIIAKNEELRAQQELLDTIPGVGEITQQILIAELPDIGHFASARQLAAWAGLTPRHFVSGTSGRSQTPITKVGSAALRRALFMPAMTARQNNPLLKAFGDRLEADGKKPKPIIIAIMRKLLHQIYGILKSGEAYNPEKRGILNHPKPKKNSTKQLTQTA